MRSSPIPQTLVPPMKAKQGVKSDPHYRNLYISGTSLPRAETMVSMLNCSEHDGGLQLLCYRNIEGLDVTRAIIWSFPQKLSFLLCPGATITTHLGDVLDSNQRLKKSEYDTGSQLYLEAFTNILTIA